MNNRVMKKAIAIGSAIALLVSGTVLPGNAQAAKKPCLNKKKASITVGKSVKLKLKNAKKKVTWSSSNKKVAVVNKKGKVTGKKAGNAKITAKSAGKKYICKVTVAKSGSSTGGSSSSPSSTTSPNSSKKPSVSTAKPGTSSKPSSSSAPGTSTNPGSSTTNSSHTRPSNCGEDTLGIGNFTVRLGMSQGEVESSMGAKPDREERSPFGFDVYIYNPSSDYTNYLMLQFDNGSLVGITTISAYFCYESLFSAGDSADALLGAGFKSMESRYDYEAGYLYESSNEYAMAFVDHQGTNQVYGAQIYSKNTSLASNTDLDKLFKVENGSYDATVNAYMAKQMFDWVNAFRAYKGAPLCMYSSSVGAQQHSDDMASTGVLQQDSSDGTSWKTRFDNNYKDILGLQEGDTMGKAENNASRSPDAFGFVTWWIDDTESTKDSNNVTITYKNISRATANYGGIEETISGYYLCTGFSSNAAQKDCTFATLDFFY